MKLEVEVEVAENDMYIYRESFRKPQMKKMMRKYQKSD